MQHSIERESGLPPFRQFPFPHYTAYSEGWGLYAEVIASELGCYSKPENYFENLASQQFRAARLVVDTGFHYKHWGRDQVVAFLHEHSTFTDFDINSETDRYAAVPAQALSYMVGQLKFMELRKRAQDQLGERFDLRSFHDEMLNGGALPLDVLDMRTDSWIARVKAGAL